MPAYLRMMFQVQIRSRGMGSEFPDLSLLTGVVAPEILNAMRAAAAKLESAGIRHALAGALAVWAHGYPRASKDVDFVVGDKAFTFHDGGISPIPHPPILSQLRKRKHSAAWAESACGCLPRGSYSGA